MKPPFDQSSSVGRGVGVLLSRTRALSSSMTRWSRSASERADPDVAVLPGTAASMAAGSGVAQNGSAPVRTSSWRAKTSKSPRARFPSGKAELMNLVESKKLRNVRESKIVELVEREGYLADIDFENKGLSLDELHIAAILMLDRAAPGAVFSDKAGLVALFEFVESVRAVYKANPYHDFRHAVDVMQFMNHLLSREDIAQRIAQHQQGIPSAGDELRFMMLVACLCHDAGHDGMTNVFHRKTQSELVEKFGVESTLERLHALHAETLIDASPLLDILREAPNVSMDATQFLQEVRSVILATDMEKHAALLSSFKATPSAQLLNVLIKISDISNVSRGFEEAKVWAKRLEAEQKMAASRWPADMSAPAPMPLASSVIGFSKMFALPLVDALTEAGLQDSGRELRARIERNIKEWEQFQNDSINPGL